MTAAKRIERVDIQVFFTKPVDQSISCSAIAERIEMAMGSMISGKKKKMIKITGIKITATIIRLAIGHTSKSPLTALVVMQRMVELFLIKIGPEYVGIIKLGIGALPEQEVGNAQYMGMIVPRCA